ncbi:YiaA/YiaB family inner membrane protein [Streptomyces sp. G-G2]|uniref:YiaA/YiaB family inner membrane protein n=1 Tax=Streptomyces sp. G-G2 TaxID=3046201 RepID=UPI0024BA93D5|nr:YiaA/YiaB family inner membrane protein [Streptomyces sp. G-G2]MDJ0381562.1 YiaA/YiaB family inner membrane protein [Streptomyces sp. G-G2]
MNETPVKQQNTGAYYGQAVASFGIAMGAVSLGIYNLDANAWVRAFLGIAVLYLTTSAFTLAKVVRDRQEVTQIVTRVDQARMEKIMTEYDPFSPRPLPKPAQDR